MGVFDFKAIKRRLDCQEQRADFEEKNPKPVEAAPVVWSAEWGYGVNVPYAEVNEPIPIGPENYKIFLEALNGAVAKQMDDCRLLASAPCFDIAPAQSSLAHPEWPYTGTPHEWPKTKI